MVQDTSKSVDEFTFKYKNILHQLDKLVSINRVQRMQLRSLFASYNRKSLALWFSKRTGYLISKKPSKPLDS